ncbi:MAG: hypothetical protein SFV17_02905 [Candidatus Obscuribacter sp.]|nr:hypothetical protein [Candidatus Obscuribacter sp.]
MTEDNRSLDRLLAWAEQQPEPSPEETTAFAERLKAMEGSMAEAAHMLENGDIAVQITSFTEGGMRGDGGFIAHPEDKDYIETKQKYRLVNPGDRRVILLRLIDNQWVVQSEQFEQETDLSTRKPEGAREEEIER